MWKLTFGCWGAFCTVSALLCTPSRTSKSWPLSMLITKCRLLRRSLTKWRTLFAIFWCPIPNYDHLFSRWLAFFTTGITQSFNSRIKPWRSRKSRSRIKWGKQFPTQIARRGFPQMKFSHCKNSCDKNSWIRTQRKSSMFLCTHRFRSSKPSSKFKISKSSKTLTSHSKASQLSSKQIIRSRIQTSTSTLTPKASNRIRHNNRIAKVTMTSISIGISALSSSSNNRNKNSRTQMIYSNFD